MQHQGTGNTLQERLDRYLDQHPIVRAGEVERRGIPREYLLRRFLAGELSRPSRGVYTRNAAPITAHRSLAEVAKRFPHAAISLVSALAFHGLTTQVPREVWVAIDRRSRRPALRSPRLRVTRVASEGFLSGVETHALEGVPVRITSPARTVAECFKFRNKVGLDVALEGLKASLREGKASREAIERFARQCRVANVIRPYMEALG